MSGSHYTGELPAYLKSVYDLRAISGVPSDEDVIGIHAVIQVADKVNVVNVPGMGDPGLTAHLSELLFDVQMVPQQTLWCNPPRGKTLADTSPLNLRLAVEYYLCAFNPR
ncbi:hypothetical protein B0J17DRAFT_630069 [Rhizoctonia solani]|nr:hypothetical protein B0J17DRAFT_630069 [Rhizoctonia solani]